MGSKVIHITGKHAVRLQRMAREGRIVRAAPSPRHNIEPLDNCLRRLEDIQAPELMATLGVSPEDPLTVLVPSDGSRVWASPSNAGLRTKLLSAKMPEGAFLELKPAQGASALPLPRDCTLLISSPQLSFVEGANALTRKVKSKKHDSLRAFLRLLKFADECCGYYYCDPSAEQSDAVLYDDFDHPTRLTCADDLAAFVDKLRNVDGLPLARKVARHAIDRSGSCMESYLNHALSLPPRYAGLSMHRPLANCQLVLSDKDRALLKHRSLRPDLQWPEFNTLGEYLGEQEHASRAARIEDKNRMQDYAGTPYTAFPLMFDDVRNATALNKTALMLAREFRKKGAKNEVKRMQKLMRNQDFLARQRILVAALLPPVTHYDA